MKNQYLIAIFLCIALIAIVIGVKFATSEKKQTYHTDAKSEIVHEENTLVDQFPTISVYPGATIEESSRRQQPINSNQDYHAVWISHDPVAKVMQWYLAELNKAGWKTTPPDDLSAEGEQVAQISKGKFSGYLGIEDEGEGTEIVVDFRKTP